MGERRVAYTTLKMAVLAPIPRMSARRATEVKPGFLSSSRRPKRTLRAKFAMPGSFKLARLPPAEILRRSVGPVVTVRCTKYAWGKKKFPWRPVGCCLGARDPAEEG